MKKDIADSLVRALRSGEYEQGQNQLRADSPEGGHKYCVLGVLCDLAAKDGVGSYVGHTFFDHTQQASDSVLTPKVVEWAGMVSNDGTLAFGSLAFMNDGFYDFNEIANTIETNWEAL